MHKLLLVDDNRDNQELLMLHLQILGSFEILLASNGKEALEVAALARPDLVLMDLKMPVMDGFEATRALRQTAWGRNMPVIAFTAYATKEHKEMALSAGCSDFIPKPLVDYSVVVHKIQALLRTGGRERPLKSQPA